MLQNSGSDFDTAKSQIAPILLIGGSGIVGRWTARLLRTFNPGQPILIGGRNLVRAKETASEIGNAQGVVLDLTAEDLGLGDQPVSAVAIFLMDDRLAALRFAQARGVPHISISPGIIEMGPEVAAYIHQPNAAPVVLGTEWLVGATTIPTLEFAKDFGLIQDISIGALLDEKDEGGPAAAADLERQTKTMPAALARCNGAYTWKVGEEVNTRFRAADGEEMEATAFSAYDVVALATATGAPNVQFSLAIGLSSSRRSGEAPSTEIIIDLSGKDHKGNPLRTRHAVIHPEGQMPLTALGVAMILERLVGLDGKPPTPAGLYFPYQLLDPTTYFARFKQIGGVISNHPFPVHRRQVQVNGASFHIIEQGQGPTVLFCHGFPDTAETWRSQMRAVAENGYHALALDMRGFGRSYSPLEVSSYSALHTVGDLVGLLDALDISSAVLVGHDWGADVAQRAMVMRPDRFRAIVSLSIPIFPRAEINFYAGLRQQGLSEGFYAFDLMKPDADDRFQPAEETIPSILYWLSGSPSAGTGWDPTDPDRHMLRPAPVPIPTWADPNYVRHNIDVFTEKGFHGGLNYYRAAQETFDLMSAFKNALIWQPSLYIWGAEDGLCQLFHPTPPTLAEARQSAPGLVDVIRLEHVGHWVQHEAADAVNTELIKFLSIVGLPKDKE